METTEEEREEQVEHRHDSEIIFKSTVRHETDLYSFARKRGRKTDEERFVHNIIFISPPRNPFVEHA